MAVLVGGGVLVAVGVSVGVLVGGTGVSVGGMGVLVGVCVGVSGGTGVYVGGAGVSVGGTGTSVASANVLLKDEADGAIMFEREVLC